MCTSYCRTERVVAVVFIAALIAGSPARGGNQAAIGFDPFASRSPVPAPAADRPAGGGPVIPQISFSNNDISMVLQIVSDATGWSVFPSADVCKAKISLWAKNISADQLLDTVVTLAGFTYHRQGNVIMVMTFDEYAQYHGLAKEVKSLGYANADAVANVVKPFLSKLGKSVVHQKTNALVLFDSPANLMTIAEIVDKLDVPEDARTILEVIDLKYMDALQLAETLQKVFAETGPVQTSSQAAPERPAAPGSGERITETPTVPAAGLSSPQSGVGVYSLNRTNQLIIKAFQGDIEKLRKLVEKLDTYVEPTSRNYHFTYVDAAEIFPGLERILDLPTRGSGAYGGGRSQGQNDREGGKICGITLVEKTNSILLTATPAVHRVMTSIVENIDVPSTYEAGVIRVYKIENADVEEIAQAIRELLERPREQEQRPGEPKYTDKRTRESPTPEGPEPGPKTDQAELSESEKHVPQIEARIAVSKATNSVIVQATARQHRELEKLVEELDKRRRQVLIESKIVEVTTSDGLEVGIELSYAGRDGFGFSHFGLSSNLDPTTGQRDIIVSPGGSAAVLRPDNVQAILKALRSNQDARITSAPRILVNDNAVGFINSIAEEPYTQVNQGQNTDTVSFGGFVEAGTQFAITPHISENDYLRVEYQITLNSFAKKPSDTSIPPPRNTSSIRSEATVPDGHTIVVGGLQTSDEQTTIDKVPILGDIPLLGLIFRNTSIRKTYKTTYLFITPIIMEQPDFADLKEISRQSVEEAQINGDADKPPRTQTAGPTGQSE